MKCKCRIELIEELPIVNIYSIKIGNSEHTEFEKFILKYSGVREHKKDFERLSYYIDKIGVNGALERYFRPESRYGNRVMALPIEINKLRLYVIRVSDNILIIGNGDIKNVDRYNKDPILSCYVSDLEQVDRALKESKNKRATFIIEKKISGRMNFKINRHEKE